MRTFMSGSSYIRWVNRPTPMYKRRLPRSALRIFIPGTYFETSGPIIKRGCSHRAEPRNAHLHVREFIYSLGEPPYSYVQKTASPFSFKDFHPRHLFRNIGPDHQERLFASRRTPKCAPSCPGVHIFVG